MGRDKARKPRQQRKEPPSSGVSEASFVMERAEWLGYIAGRHSTAGVATSGGTYSEMKAEVKAVAYHEEQPDGSWEVLLYPLDGRPPQAQQTEESVRTLHSSLTVASFLADAVMDKGSTVLHTIGGDPYRLVQEYRTRHPQGLPTVNRIWADVQGVPERLQPTGPES